MKELGLRRLSGLWGRAVYEVTGLPLVGHIAFGVIDRGTNVLQVRPSTLCPHSCIFCSVDAGPMSRRRSEYLVEPRLLLKWVRAVAELKGPGLEALLDGVGEPLTHPGIADIVAGLRHIPQVARVALETHGGFLSKRLLELLDKAGLDRVNLSLDTLDPAKARRLAGVEWYDVRRIVSVVEWAVENTGIDFILTPVVVPGYNDSIDDLKGLVELARSLSLGRKVGWPTGVLVQKYESHRYGRKPQGSRPWGWGRFYKWLRRAEEELGYRLIVDMAEIGMEERPRIPKPYRVGDRVPLIVVGEGWLPGEALAVDLRWSRVVSLVGVEDARPGARLTGRIIRDRDNIYLARP